MNEQNVPGRTKERGGGATHNRVTEEHAKNKMDSKRPLDGKLLSSALLSPSPQAVPKDQLKNVQRPKIRSSSSSSRRTRLEPEPKAEPETETEAKAQTATAAAAVKI